LKTPGRNYSLASQKQQSSVSSELQRQQTRYSDCVRSKILIKVSSLQCDTTSLMRSRSQKTNAI